MPDAPKPPSRFWKFVKRLFVLSLVGLVLGVGATVGAFVYYSRDLPSVEELKSWRPSQVSKVTCKDGSVCGEFFIERRTWVDLATLPPHVKNAFLAAEDADFYQHEGLDYLGMLRAGLKALVPGGRMTGASTISQQACRNLLLSQERSLSRKIKEWILTPRMEKALSKDEILSLYVNIVWFGNQRYGIEEASLFYFGKHARELSLSEASVLAGTVQSPARINPVTNIVKAKRRQKYVLTQLARHKFVEQKVIDAEMEKPIVLGPRPPAQVGQYYLEDIRKQLAARYGDKKLLEGGMRVEIAMDPALQAAAEQSLREGLEALDRRQGYRGHMGTLSPERFSALKPLLEKKLAEAGKRRPDEVLIADLTALKASKPEPEEQEAPEPEQVAGEPEEKPETADEVLVRGVSVHALQEGLFTVGVVTAVDDTKAVATVDVVGRTAQLPFSAMAWARPRDAKGTLGPSPKKVSDVVQPGALIRVRLGKSVPASRDVEAALAQVPAVEGALVAIDPVDRSVVALVGGYDFNRSVFNRATQAKRQPGSSFKPFIYGAALESEKYTTISIINDAPEVVRDPYTGKVWKPQNYEKGGYDGPLTLRQALTHSKNTVSVRLIEALTPPTVTAFAQKAGIHSQMPDNLTLALGTGEVAVLEIANAYATLQSLGKSADPVMLIKVSDSKGTVLEEHHAALEETLSPAIAYLTTSLMRSVVEEGTAMAVRDLERPAAGKTGTAQEFRDAWFSGYTMDLVATAWVGFDDHSPLGPGETGGKAALPVWLSFMKVAHAGKPVRDFEPPPGVQSVRIDPVTRLLAGKSVPGRLEPFLDGTQPTAFAPAPGSVDPNDFMLQDGRRRGL
jgi:penicillin-binding protein 1A